MKKIMAVVVLSLGFACQARLEATTLVQLENVVTHLVNATFAFEVYNRDDSQDDSLSSQYAMRHEMYWLDKHNPRFYKLYEYQRNLDYCIAILQDHIALLEGKIAAKSNGLNSWAIIKGVGFSGVSGLFAYAMHVVKGAKIINEAGLEQSNVGGAVFMGVISAISASAAIYKFYKAYNYEQRLTKRLERDKHLLSIFEKERSVVVNK